MGLAMKLQLFSSRFDGMVKTSRILLATNAALAIALVLVSAKVFNKEPVVAIVPPNLTEEARISYNAADAEYLMSFGLYVTTLTGNITPQNVLFVTDALSSLVDATLYPSVREQMLALASDPVFKERGTAVYFEPVDVSFDIPTNKVFVKGNQIVQTVAGKPKRIPYVYEIEIEVSQHRPKVIALDKYEGRVAHDLEWERKNKRNIEREEEKAKKEGEAKGPWFNNRLLYGESDHHLDNEQESNSVDIYEVD